MNDKVKVGIIGCGNIFPAYIKGSRKFPIVDLVACADIDMDRARARAKEFEIPTACTVAELLARKDVEIVINLTIPLAHAVVSLAVLNAGKHVHSEKPLAAITEDGKKIMALAKKKGLRVGCAPDTFLGGGQQTCRKLIDDGAIGEPVAATAFMTNHGHESWHPNPSFYYKPGGGPMLDMGPYYITALVNLMGPIKRVTGSSRMTFPERICTSEARKGERIKVEVDTHVAGVIDFVNGAVATIITSFDIWAANLPRIEIYGSEGSLSVPDPNTFGGTVKLRRSSEKDWTEIPLTHDIDVQRGMGVADLAYALRSGRPHRATGEMGYHALEVMHGFGKASESGRHVIIKSPCTQPKAIPVGLAKGTLDA